MRWFVRRSQGLSTSLIWVSLAAASCGERMEERPATQGCQEDCSADPRGAVARPTWPNGDGGAGSGGPSNGTGEGVDLEGTIYWMDSTDLAPNDTRIYVQGATVSMPLASGTKLVSVDARGGHFSIEDVIKASHSFLAVVPEAATAALPTLQWIDTEGSQTVRAGVVSAAALDLAFSVVSTPRTRDPGAAQVLLRFVDEVTGTGLRGVRVEVPVGSKAIYDLGSSFTDQNVGSGSRGLVLLQNVPVGGSDLQTLTLRFASDSSFVEATAVLVGGGMVTYLAVPVTE